MTEDTNYIRLAMSDVSAATSNMESAINSTPTSERRNMMTEANIHLMLAYEKLIEIEFLQRSR